MKKTINEEDKEAKQESIVTVFHLTYLGHNSLLAVSREGVSRVMHDGAVVIILAEPADYAA